MTKLQYFPPFFVTCFSTSGETEPSVLFSLFHFISEHKAQQNRRDYVTSDAIGVVLLNQAAPWLNGARQSNRIKDKVWKNRQWKQPKNRQNLSLKGYKTVLRCKSITQKIVYTNKIILLDRCVCVCLSTEGLDLNWISSSKHAIQRMFWTFYNWIVSNRHNKRKPKFLCKRKLCGLDSIVVEIVAFQTITKHEKAQRNTTIFCFN